MKESYDYILISTDIINCSFNAHQYCVFLHIALRCDRRYKVEAKSLRRELYTKRSKQALAEIIEEGIIWEDEVYLEISDDYKKYIRFAPEELTEFS